MLYWKNLLDCAGSGSEKTWSLRELVFCTQTALQLAMRGCREGKAAGFDGHARKVVVE